MRGNKISISTIIGKDAECNGNFETQGSARIDGTINGNVTVSEMLILGAAGYVSGDILAKTVIIGGEVIGNINALEKAEITSTGKVIGDITTTTIVIDEHAIFQGRCDMKQDVPAKRGKPNARAMKMGKKTAKAAIEEALKEVEEASKGESFTEGAVGGEGGFTVE